MCTKLKRLALVVFGYSQMLTSNEAKMVMKIVLAWPAPSPPADLRFGREWEVSAHKYHIIYKIYRTTVSTQ